MREMGILAGALLLEMTADDTELQMRMLGQTLDVCDPLTTASFSGSEETSKARD